MHGFASSNRRIRFRRGWPSGGPEAHRFAELVLVYERPRRRVAASAPGLAGRGLATSTGELAVQEAG